MKINVTKWLISVGQLAEILEVNTEKVMKSAESAGITHFDMQLNNVAYFDATNAARIILGIAKADGDVTFPGHPVLLGEIGRLKAEQAVTAKEMN